MGDSIPKYLEWEGLLNKALRGATIGKTVDMLTFMVREDRDNLAANHIILHIGSNNIVPGTTVGQWADEYKILLKLLRSSFPHAVIYCSAVIPKPCQGRTTQFIIRCCNELMCLLAAKANQVYLPTYKCFVAKGGSVKCYLYSEKYLLHLNGAGVTEMSLYFRSKLYTNQVKGLHRWTQNRASKLEQKFRSRGYPAIP